MESKQYIQSVQSVQNTYSFLRLTFEQAENVYNLIKDGIDFNSVYERADFTELLFKDFLSEEQYLLLQKVNQSMIQDAFPNMALRSIDYLKEVEVYNNIFNFQKKLSDKILNEKKYEQLLEINSNKEAMLHIENVKGCYQKFLANGRKNIISDHIRTSRKNHVARLKSSLAKHRIFYAWPSLYFFQPQDYGVGVSYEYLENYVKTLLSSLKDLVMKIFNELNSFISTQKINSRPVTLFWDNFDENKVDKVVLSFILRGKDGYDYYEDIKVDAPKRDIFAEEIKLLSKIIHVNPNGILSLKNTFPMDGPYSVESIFYNLGQRTVESIDGVDEPRSLNVASFHFEGYFIESPENTISKIIHELNRVCYKFECRVISESKYKAGESIFIELEIKDQRYVLECEDSENGSLPVDFLKDNLLPLIKETPKSDYILSYFIEDHITFISIKDVALARFFNYTYSYYIKL